MYEVKPFIDKDIVKAYHEVRETFSFEHVDGMDLITLLRIRSKLPVNEPDMICLNWLQRRLVALRKQSKLKKEDKNVVLVRYRK